MKISSLALENVKRVKAVSFEPKSDGLTVIGGKNGQGKTSILDAIAWALGGEKYRPSSEANDDSAFPPRLEVHMDNGIVVIREGKNSALRVIDPSGKRAGQQLLDQFVEKLALDLPKFLDASPKEKAKTLLKVIGMEKEINDLDQKEQDLYNRRHALGQIADQKMKYAKEMREYPDVPDELVSASDLISKQQAIIKKNAENAAVRENLSKKKNERVLLLAKKKSLDDRVAEIRSQIKELENDLMELQEEIDEAEEDVNRLVDESTEELENSIHHVEEINAKIRANMDKKKAESEASDISEQYSAMSRDIEDVRKQRIDLLSSANLPLIGLSIEQGELLFNGKKWDCMSGAEQIKVSAAIVQAINPECKFILIDKLEQFDLDTLQEFGSWLEEQGLQAICTRVSTGSECEIIISDGYVEEKEQEIKKWKAGEF